MKNQKHVESRLTGYIGECYVAYELAKRGIKAQRMDNFVVNYDFITKEGVKIEVKASRPILCWNGPRTSQTESWGWNNGKDTYICKGGATCHEKASRSAKTGVQGINNSFSNLGKAGKVKRAVVLGELCEEILTFCEVNKDKTTKLTQEKL